MTTHPHAFRISILSTSLLAAFDAAYAQDATVAELKQPESFISIGAGYWTKDRPHEGMFDGMQKGGKGYGLFDFDLVKRNDETATWLTLRGRDLGLNTRDIRGEWLRQGYMGAYIEYSSIPRESPYTFTTGLQGVGTTIQTVSGTGAFAFPFVEVFPGTKRDIWDAGFYRNLMPGLDFRASFKNEEKDGYRNWGRGGAPEFAVEPINSTTRQFESKLQYNVGRLQLEGGYLGSWYDNNAGAYVDTRTNPFSASTQYFLTLPLSNEAHQGFFNGGFNFTPTTRGTFKFQYTHATAKEDLATKSIPGLSLASSPNNLGGEINTTVGQLALTSRPMKDLSLLGSLRYYHTQEKTPQARYVWTGTGAPTVDRCNVDQTCVDNTPLSFKTWSGKLEATYRLPINFSLIGGIERSDQDRTIPVGINSIDANGVDRQRYVPFRATLDETTYRLQLRRSMGEAVTGSVAYLHSKRDGSNYDRTNEAESDLINPMHIADRKRDRWRGTLDWTPVDRFSVAFNVEDARDDYTTTDARPYGLTDGKAQMFSVDATYAFNEKWSVNAYLSYDKSEAKQRTLRAGSSSLSWLEKNGDLEDKGFGFGLGLRGQVSEKIKVGTDSQYIRTKSSFSEPVTVQPVAGSPNNVIYPSGVTGPLNDVENKLTRIRVFASYAVQKNGELRFDAVYERYQTDDWTWQFANGSSFIYGTPGDGTVVTQQGNQQSNFFSIRYIYKFQ